MHSHTCYTTLVLTELHTCTGCTHGNKHTQYTQMCKYMHANTYALTCLCPRSDTCAHTAILSHVHVATLTFTQCAQRQQHTVTHVPRGPIAMCMDSYMTHTLTHQLPTHEVAGGEETRRCPVALATHPGTRQGLVSAAHLAGCQQVGVLRTPACTKPPGDSEALRVWAPPG